MTTKIFVSVTIAFILSACNNNPVQDKPKTVMPEALKDNNVYEMVSGRGDNIAEKLYDEVVSKDPALKELEEKIAHLNDSESDSAASFNRFDGKTRRYFNSVDGMIAEIGDTVLRDRMKVLVAGSLKRYEEQIAKHSELKKSIKEKQMMISDLRTVIVIKRTLPLIEQYQKENLPGTKSLEGFIKQQDQVISLVDTLVKK